MHTSLRLRLAVWYASLLAVILAVTLVLSYSFHSTTHYEDVDRFLVGTAVHVLGGVKMTAAQRLDASANLPPVDEFASPDIYVKLYDPDGQLVASSPNAGRQPDVDPRQAMASPGGAVDDGGINRLMRSMINLGKPSLPSDGAFETVAGPQGGRTRLYVFPLRGEGTASGYIEAGESLNRLDDSMARLRWLLGTMAVIGALLALLGGWAIAGSALHPVAAMASTASAIALSRGFSRRLPDLGRRDELGQLAAAFNDMLASLDEAYRTQQRFVADASHELRAPLTAIQGNLELLERTPELREEEKAEALSYLRKEASRMSRLVADLLVLARADAGQGLKQQPVELDRLLVETFHGARGSAAGRKVSLRELDQIQVQGDPDRLKQLLVILVDNALKYTPEGCEVRLALGKEHGAAVITVTDTGIGIEAQDLPHVFERFYRADKARSRDEGGSGLGLSIARWIAERHGGDISVNSAPGVGSTFIVRLPLKHSPRKL